MAAPTFVDVGAPTSTSGTDVVVWPAGHQADDIGVLVVQTANQSVATPAGWTAIGNVGTGTAGAAGSTALWVFYKRATSSAEASVSVTDPGDHFRARIMVFRGCETSGSPIDGSVVTGTAASATAVSIANPTTTVVDTMVVSLVGNATDATNNQTTVGSWINAALTGFTRIINGNTNVGVGGGIDGGAGTKATAGAVGASASTLSTASAQALLAFALKPPQGVIVPPVTEGGIYVATGVKATAGTTGTTTATLDTATVQARITFALKPPAAPPANLPPVVDPIPAIVGAINAPVQFPIVASDPEGLDVTVSLTDGDTPVPSGAAVTEDEQSGLFFFEWTPVAGQGGEWTFNVSVSDGTNTTVRPVKIVVQDEADTTLLDLATAFAERMESDVDSARALADLLDLREQMNAKVIHDVRRLISDLQETQEFVENTLEQLQDETDPV